jgi:hypothetical protein
MLVSVGTFISFLDLHTSGFSTSLALSIDNVKMIWLKFKTKMIHDCVTTDLTTRRRRSLTSWLLETSSLQLLYVKKINVMTIYVCVCIYIYIYKRFV